MRNNAMVIGITGTIASGKSTVCSYLQKEYGAVMIDADKVGHAVLQEPSMIRSLTGQFGESILSGDRQSIDRKALGRIVFADPEKLLLLNSLTHPRICERIREQIAAIASEKTDAVILLEAVELLRSPLRELVSEVWVVWAEENVRLERVMRRDGLSREDAKCRLAGQWPQEEYKKAADWLIDGTQSLERVHQVVDERLTGLGRKKKQGEQ